MQQQIITTVPEHTQVDVWIYNLPEQIYVNQAGLANWISSWRHYLGLKPIKIIVVRKK